jgi:hypothetical protein
MARSKIEDFIKLLELIEQLLDRNRDNKKKTDKDDDLKAKLSSRIKMLDNKVQKAEEDLFKEQKQSGLIQAKNRELKEKINNLMSKSSGAHIEKSKSIPKKESSLKLLESELLKKDKELIRLREIIKRSSFGFNQKFETNNEFHKFFPLSGVQSNHEETEEILSMMHESKNFSKQLIEEVKILKDFLATIYGIIVKKKSLLADQRVISLINGTQSFPETCNQIYEIFCSII